MSVGQANNPRSERGQIQPPVSVPTAPKTPPISDSESIQDAITDAEAEEFLEKINTIMRRLQRQVQMGYGLTLDAPGAENIFRYVMGLRAAYEDQQDRIYRLNEIIKEYA